MDSRATFAHSHICRREEQIQSQVIVLRLDDETGLRAPRLPRSPTCCEEPCHGLSDCGVRSMMKLLWAKLPASVGEDWGVQSRLHLKRAKLLHRVQRECTKAGHLQAVFGPYSLHLWSMRLIARWMFCDFQGLGRQLEVLRVVYTIHSTNGYCQQSNTCSKRAAT